MSCIQFIAGCCLNVFYCRVDQELEVSDCKGATIDIVEGRNVVVVTYFWLEGVEKLFGFDEADLRNVWGKVRSLSDQMMVKTKLFAGGAGLNIWRHCLKFAHVVEEFSCNIFTVKCLISYI